MSLQGKEVPGPLHLEDLPPYGAMSEGKGGGITQPPALAALPLQFCYRLREKRVPERNSWLGWVQAIGVTSDG